MEKLHKQDYEYKFAEKTMEDVTLELIVKRTEKYLSNANPFHALVKDNGRLIIAFRTSGWYEHYRMELEQENIHGDTWVQFGDEKVFSFSDEIDNYNIVVAEFYTLAKFDAEHDKMIEDMSNAFFETSTCSCGDGGCPSCRPSWFM